MLDLKKKKKTKQNKHGRGRSLPKRSLSKEIITKNSMQCVKS